MMGKNTLGVGRLAVILGAILGVGAPAFAQAPAAAAEELQAPPDLPEPTPEQREQATASFAHGVELFRQGAFRAALVELKRAYELVPDYRVLFNIGQTHAQISQYVEAIDAFEKYLSYAGDELDAERRSSVEQIVAGLRTHVALLSVSVDENGAEVFVDGERMARAPLMEPLRVQVGRHRVEARTTDGRTASQDVNLIGGDRMEIMLRVGAANPLPAAAVLAEPAPEPAKDRTARKVGIGLMAGGGVALLGAGVFALLAHGAHEDLDKALDKPNNSKDVEHARDSVRTNAVLSDVSLALGVMAATVGAVLFYYEPESSHADEKRSLKLGLSPGGLRAWGRF